MRTWNEGVFNRLWNTSNRPTLTAIGAITTWTLPTGYSYSKRADRIVDSSGTPVALDSDWYADASDEIAYIPTRMSDQTLTMVASGLLPSGSREAFILADDYSTIESAWAIEIDGERYHLRNADGIPGGSPHVYRLRLAHE